jgi:hypothetical protein
MGIKVTEGLGAGAKPSVGAAAAEESIQQIVDHLAARICASSPPAWAAAPGRAPRRSSRRPPASWAC